MALVKPLDENEIETELCEFIQFFKGPLGVIPNSAVSYTHLTLPTIA